ncbi:MAG: membrane integrity-associated transporter subunit PqiC [Sphingomonadales bacterium]|nr:membrane integrity-associated transporter subunit PqiC [Sphingomonadales bacterium]
MQPRSPGRGRWAAPALAMLVAGCVNLGGGKPLPSLMTLSASAPAPAGQTLATPTTRAIVVFTPTVERSLATTRVPVRIDPTALAYLKGAAWVESPAHLFGALLVETIRARGQLLVLAEDQPQASLHLAGTLGELGYDAQARAVVVRFDAERSGRDHQVSTRRFEASVAGVGPNAAAIAPALNLAATRVAGEVADWVAQ